jgi:mercuric ion transport protein
MLTTPSVSVMNTIATSKRSAVLNYFSLFTSPSTLLCPALPSLFVLFGLGASVASMLSFMPWLVTLSRHKQWTFGVSGVLIALSFVNMYYIAPRIRAKQCNADDPSACEEASRLSIVLLWVSAGIYALGVFVAYVLGPILTRSDNA